MPIHPQLRHITARKLIRALERDGFVHTRSRGSHHVYRHNDGRRVIVAYHRLGDTFAPGTLNTILKGTRWDDKDLQRLGLISK